MPNIKAFQLVVHEKKMFEDLTKFSLLQKEKLICCLSCCDSTPFPIHNISDFSRFILAPEHLQCSSIY